MGARICDRLKLSKKHNKTHNISQQNATFLKKISALSPSAFPACTRLSVLSPNNPRRLAGNEFSPVL